MKIIEIYKSIQGESLFSGWPCIFIRTAGCNLRCSYCDTKYAYKDGKEISVKTLLPKIKKYKAKLVEITGGEPLLQKDLILLIKELLRNKYKVLIETNGSLDISNIPVDVIKIIDIKCPGSHMSDKNYFKNINYLTKKDEVKFVITDKSDYDWAKRKIKALSLDKKTNITFSPVWKSKYFCRNLAEWILTDGLDVRFQVQLHKIIWPLRKRGR